MVADGATDGRVAAECASKPEDDSAMQATRVIEGGGKQEAATHGSETRASEEAHQLPIRRSKQ
jgi:hypothetical protein